MNKFIALILILLMASSLASALTIEEAKQMALSKNNKYLAQKSAYESAKWSKQQALGGLLPSLALSGSYVYLDPAVTVNSGAGTTTLNHDSRSAALTLSQPIFMGGKLWQAYKITGITAEINFLNLENTRLSIVNEVESKYYNILQLKELMAISEKDLSSSRQNLATMVIRFESGVASQVDYLRIKARVASKEVALIQSQTAYELAMQDFINYLSLTDAVEIQPIGNDFENNELNTLAEYTTQQTSAFTGKALSISNQNNLSLKTATVSTQLYKKAYNLARGAFLPTILLSASRSFKENGIDRMEFEGTNTIALTASVPLLPIWNNYSGSRKAYYDLKKSEYDLQTASDGISLGTKAAALNLISSARQYKAAQVALQFTEQTYQQMQERFKNNMLSTTDMLDAEVMLQAAQVSKTTAFFTYLKAQSALLQALGTDKIEIIDSLME